MDFHLKQWRNQRESDSDQQYSAKIPKLVIGSETVAEPHPQPSSASSVLPLFVPQQPSTKISTLSALTDSTNSSPSARMFPPRMGSYFSLAQWQELELQALIFRYMLAGAAVPPELLHPIKKSLLHSPHYFLHHPLQHHPHYQPAFVQSGYWGLGRAALDPEPGRCRRTDGKKWRCSRDVVAGQKYCERHMHRGRNRSRKPVELPTPITSVGCGATTSCPFTNVSAASSDSLNLLQPDRSSSGSNDNKSRLLEPQNCSGANGHDRSDGHILRHFFDDWPRSLQESYNGEVNASSTKSATCLSISMPGNPSSSDVSLKLSTGDGEEDPSPRNGSVGPEHPQLIWAAAGWASTHQVASMGGPLAEALRRSSNSSSSPTSVLHILPPGSASETSFISA